MSVVAETNSAEVVAAMEGGSTFDTRLNELRTARAAIEKAQTELRLGQEAHVAWDKARLDREAAERFLAEAKTTAAELLEQAKSQAEAMRSDATEALARARADAEQKLVQADAAARATLDAAAEEAKKAASRTALAGRRMKEAEETKAAAEALAADAQAKIDAATAEQQRFSNLISDIKALVASA